MIRPRRILCLLLAASMVLTLIPSLTLTAKAVTYGPFTITPDEGYTYSGNVLTITDDGNYTISMHEKSTTDRIVVRDGLTTSITLQNVDIDRSAQSNVNDSCCAFFIGTNATVNLTIEGKNQLMSGSSRAGLQVSPGAKLMITGSLNDTLYAKGGGNSIGWAAGIGAGSSITGNSGNITINGGTIEAIGSNDAAGIGGSSNDSGGAIITINGGKVTAQGGSGAAGIGGGARGKGGNVVIINGGEVQAKGGPAAGAGIGGGTQQGNSGDNGSVTINGGIVRATGGASGGAGIGSGNATGVFGSITINGGTVDARTADASSIASGIGCGQGGTCDAVTINGGTIVATRGSQSASDIGKNLRSSNCGAVTIRGGSINTPNKIISPTPTNGTSNVYLSTLNFFPAAGNQTEITAGNIDGVDCDMTQLSESHSTLNGYGLYDVQTDNMGKTYLWLPQASNAQRIGLTVNDTDYGYQFTRRETNDTTSTLKLRTIFTAVQVGGASNAAGSTGIVLTFDRAITGLKDSNITITNDTGAVIRGAIDDNNDKDDKTWRINLISVNQPGNVSVKVVDFETYWVDMQAVSVEVFAICQHAVRWEADGGLPAPTQLDVDHGGSIIQPVPMTKDGYTFGGWFTDSTLNRPANFPLENVTGASILYAKWLSLDASLLTVAGQDVTAGTEKGTISAPKTASIAVPNSKSVVTLADLTAAKNAVINIYSDSGFEQNKDTDISLGVGANHIYIKVTAEDTAKVMHYDITVIRQGDGSSSGGSGGGNSSTTRYTVTFHSNGGSVVNAQSVIQGAVAIKPANPAKESFVFAGWFSDSALTKEYSFKSAVTGNITLYAKWEVTQSAGSDGSDNTIAQAEGKFPFTDVLKDDWFYNHVHYVWTNNIFSGTSDTTFNPNMPMTRGMLVTVLWRMAESPAASGIPFGDVMTDQYYSQAVAWAAEHGIVSGMGDGSFAPSAEITREQMAAILWRYAQFKAMDVSAGGDTDILSFGDAINISKYAVDAMQWGCGTGIISGKPGNLLNPRGSATRAEVAAMLHRFMELVK